MKNNDHVLDILEFTFPEVLKYILLLRVWEFEREFQKEREREGGGAWTLFAVENIIFKTCNIVMAFRGFNIKKKNTVAEKKSEGSTCCLELRS